PLIFSWRRHNRASAVAHQYIIGDPNRNLLVAEQITRVGAGKYSGLLLDGREPLDVALAAGLGDVLVDLLALPGRGDFSDQWMFRREHHEGYAEHSIGTRSEKPHFPGVVADDGESQLGAFGAADPVALHQLDRFRPIDSLKIG